LAKSIILYILLSNSKLGEKSPHLNQQKFNGNKNLGLYREGLNCISSKIERNKNYQVSSTEHISELLDHRFTSEIVYYVKLCDATATYNLNPHYIRF
jgi:hypothetical protein